jgi:hypothetical protein
MKIATSTALASSGYLALLGAASAFTVGGRQAGAGGSNGFFLSSTTSTPTTARHATVETSTYAKLVPPPSIQEATEHAQDLYDTNVQKTYGYVLSLGFL